MADRLKRGQSLLIATLAMGGAAPVAAQSALGDPMRPPSAAAAAPATPASATPGGYSLQTIVLQPNGKALAVINGETVALGGSIGSARLVKLSDSEAVLQGPQGREVLKLTPAAGKRASVALPPRPQAEDKR